MEKLYEWLMESGIKNKQFGPSEIYRFLALLKRQATKNNTLIGMLHSITYYVEMMSMPEQ